MSNIGTKFILAQRFVFDPNSNSLVDQMSDGEVVRLGSNESRILLMLSERPNEVITRNELHEYVWRDQGFEVDDSSLTQAVSTLRKMLKDSTKSPEFVKTVPKRGYQFIATVERSAPLSSNDQPVAAEITENDVEPILTFATPAATEETITETVESEPIAKVQETKVELEPATAPVTAPAKNTNKWLTFWLLLAAFIMPILVLTFTNPAESEFKTLAEIDDVKVQSPINHPDLSSWLPAIEKCVLRYNTNHTGMLKPTEVIATGGQTNNLALNYIHPQEYSSENVTLRIYANQSDVNDICNGGQ
ncbi:Cholera toxin homolog transcriptional activator [Vibrio crassostreae]|uniref:transcriptional regulator n=1 Tax=Vibrio crassostreae TaxID=246167 RepID=UPI00104E7B02|nr:transcriptional regulator [Vibrio crassostreae]TCN83111.1 cholera toxin transcriptional activator [Vibrio crassostreae]CAK2477917.1 Cholera toxin homolog transcriptional activator [Vibrio crassostreae]CAK2550672.1 Cholera toxin homolog transcriptional activator [Vibrio crassostreae]CAK3907262.1 Cholera toxin homolog transcriptional activator [Vibrio crassostreae]CAK3916759.1 Cholera toxin homolog transcriptional activator [Vibrio crassostreae]